MSKNYYVFSELAAQKGAQAGDARIRHAGFNVFQTSSGEKVCATHVLTEDSEFPVGAKIQHTTNEDLTLVRYYNHFSMLEQLINNDFDLEKTDEAYAALQANGAAHKHNPIV
ncbi:MAG: hypothetical protein CBB87_03985 [Micavibrio sp. TMED27]|nr:hypothetical protein [Micavibrio sp.]OUT91981.1 MAG: hypothetical protein CBB87_03985 [Micavibrio sp. TMED27]|tara:strand:- start:4763 stop:5098 length:336 start_codon:yes stop_codon:yes gene_type:complete